MKHLLLILISLLLLSSPVIGHPKGEHTLYKWDTSSGEVWKGFGDKETHPKYKGDVKNRKPNGLGIMITPWGTKYSSDGGKFVGEYRDGKVWNGTHYEKDGNILFRYDNGIFIEL